MIFKETRRSLIDNDYYEFAECARRPRTAQKIKTHGHEADLCGKGGLIFSFVATFSVPLLCGRQKRKKTRAGHKIQILESATTKNQKQEIKPFTQRVNNCWLQDC